MERHNLNLRQHLARAGTEVAVAHKIRWSCMTKVIGALSEHKTTINKLESLPFFQLLMDASD
ncbi:hypothetical protein [Enterobacter sp. MGH 14]|uniref:hypothetical protein n=1 Tax=Enterobacter sp. MGH 14 TaxID=1329823 RepID=UPI00350FDF49